MFEYLFVPSYKVYIKLGVKNNKTLSDLDLAI